MAEGVPSLEDVIEAVGGVVEDAAETWSTVLTSEISTESERLGIEQYQERDDDNNEEWAVDLYTVTAKEVPGPAGEAPGENYGLYRVLVTYRNVRSASAASWEAAAREAVAAVVGAIDGNPLVFRIDGQPQLRTPETCSVESQGFELVEGMNVFKAKIRLEVEARRWTS